MDSLEQISKDITLCQRCELRAGATQPVPGLGEPGAKYFIIGEAPGHSEDKEGVPFVGAAGKKLDRLLELAGISVNDCYISNVCRCRPPKNRDPRKKEVKACVGFLQRELELVRPETVITLGSTPLGLFVPYGVRQVHGTQLEATFDKKEYHVIAQFHPAAALHQPRLWADMLSDWEHLPTKVNTDFIVCPNPELNLTGMPLASLDTETDHAGGVGQWSVAYRDGEGSLTVAPFYGSKVSPTYGNCPVAMHNVKYDARELRRLKMPVPEKIHDTMILAYCMGLGKQAPKDEGKKTSGADMVGGLGLKYLARRHLGMQMQRWQDMEGHPEWVPEYNAKDSVATLLLAEKWLPEVGKFYYDIDMPLLPVLMAIEDRGVKIDPDYLTQFAADLDKQLAEFPEEVQHLAFHTQDLQSYIYGTLGLEPWKFTDGGSASVEAEVLEVINDPLIKDLLRYKELYKDKGTYVDNYVKLRDYDDRIHPEYKQTSTSTSRLSCARPNMQNMDKSGNMRKLVVAKEGHSLVRMDFNQLDFRALACITLDPILLAALAANKKIHQVTAEKMGISYDDAKTVNFGVMFGQEAWALAGQLHITLGQARDFLQDYFKTFPGIKKFREEMTERIKAEKHVTIPLTGRKRRIDAMYVDQWRIQQEGIKEGINLPVQGTEAEVVKIVMNDLHYKHSAPMILQVHDELVFEVPDNEVKEYAAWLNEYVPTIITVNDVKFPVAVTSGKNWKECS